MFLPRSNLAISAVLSILATVLSMVAAQGMPDGMPDGMDFGNMPGFGDKPCPSFRCTGGYSPVQKTRAKFVSKGCSKMGGGMMMMGAGSGNEQYASCCDAWHACYQTCGASKKGCDEGFKTCSEKMCAGDEDCKKSADMNSMMLNMGGCNLYDQGQYGACECAKSSKVEEKRSAAIRSFYKKYAPENVDKADALAKKADSAGKMAALFRKLTAKYPASIQIAVDDELAMYEKMMKDAKMKDKDKSEGNEEEGTEEDIDIDSTVNMDDEF